MSFDIERHNALLKHYADTVDFSNAAEVLAARVHLGTASFTERLRYYFKLGPSKRARVAAETSRRTHEIMAGWGGRPRKDPFLLDTDETK